MKRMKFVKCVVLKGLLKILVNYIVNIFKMASFASSSSSSGSSSRKRGAYDDDNDWDKEVVLSEGDRTFISELNKKTAKEKEAKDKFDTIKNNIIGFLNATKHSIRDSIMIAVQPDLTYAIGSQEEKYKKLANIENIIYKLVTKHFTSIDDEISLDSISNFINNNSSIRALITLAFKRNLSIQGKVEDEVKNLKISDETMIAYIINLLCFEVDYTSMEYNNEILNGMLTKCLPSEEELKIDKPPINFAVGTGISYRQDPVTTSWYKKEDGSEKLIPLTKVKDIQELKGINQAGEDFKRARLVPGGRKTKKHHKKSKNHHKSKKHHKKSKQSKRKH
jgi:hypothetical protein